MLAALAVAFLVLMVGALAVLDCLRLGSTLAPALLVGAALCAGAYGLVVGAWLKAR